MHLKDLPGIAVESISRNIVLYQKHKNVSIIELKNEIVHYSYFVEIGFVDKCRQHSKYIVGPKVTYHLQF